MKPIPLSQIKDKETTPDAMNILCVEGVITKLFKEITGDGQYGSWALQNGELKDSEGTTIEITFSNNTQPMSAKGQSVKIMSTQTEHGWRGVVVEDKPASKKGDKTFPAKRILKITGVAQITYSGGQAAGSGQSTSGTSQQSNRPQENYPSQKPSEIIKDVLAMHDHVFTLVNDHYKDQSETLRQSFIASVFIEANKQGACQHFIKRESHEKKEERKVDQDNLFPADWPFAIVPSGSQKGKTLKEVDDEKLLQLFEYYDKKQDNSPFAECVYQSVRDRSLTPPQPEEPDDLP